MALKDLIVLFTLCHGKAIIPSQLSFYTSSKSIPPSPEPPISNCQCAFPIEASNMFISLTIRVFTSKKTAQLDVATCGTRWGPATPQRKIYSESQGQVIKQMGSQSIRRKISGNTDLLFRKKKVLKLKNYHVKSCWVHTDDYDKPILYQKCFQRVFIEFVPALVRVLALLPSQLYSAPGKIWFLPSSFIGRMQNGLKHKKSSWTPIWREKW